jgi:hypothetical protein
MASSARLLEKAEIGQESGGICRFPLMWWADARLAIALANTLGQQMPDSDGREQNDSNSSQHRANLSRAWRRGDVRNDKAANQTEQACRCHKGKGAHRHLLRI